MNERLKRMAEIAFVVCAFLFVAAKFPLNKSFLQTDLNANGFSIINLEQEAAAADNSKAASTAWVQAEAIDQGWATGGSTFTNYLAGSGFVTITGAARSGSNTINGVANGAFTNAVQAAQWVASPAATNSAGTAGMAAYSDNYIYICVSNATWRRAILSAWQ